MKNVNETSRNNIELVSLTADNWDVYKEIRLRGLREDPQAFGSSLEREEAFTKERWMERVKNPYNVIAMDGQNPVGTMGAFVTEEDPTTAYIVGVFVAKEARGKGIGSKLLEEVLKRVRQNIEIKKIDLTVNKQQIPAIKLYENYRFEITGEEKTTMGDGQEHEEHRMTLEL